MLQNEKETITHVVKQGKKCNKSKKETSTQNTKIQS